MTTAASNLSRLAAIGVALAAVFAPSALMAQRAAPTILPPRKAPYMPFGVTDQSLLVGQSAKPFTLCDVNGNPHSLAEYRGQVVVLNFWGFWCDTWKAEMPYLESLTRRERELGFTVVAISVDGKRLAEFRQNTKVNPPPFPVLLDPGGNVSAAYNVAHVPTVVILDRDGVVRYVKSGYPGNDAVLSQVKRCDDGAQSAMAAGSSISSSSDSRSRSARESKRRS